MPVLNIRCGVLRLAVLTIICMLSLPQGAMAQGITSSVDNHVIINDNPISTTGVGADGIGSNGANAVIINNGEISTSGAFATGIVATGANAVITNSDSGAISTTGAGADGIFAIGADAVIGAAGALFSAAAPNAVTMVWPWPGNTISKVWFLGMTPT